MGLFNVLFTQRKGGNANDFNLNPQSYESENNRIDAEVLNIANVI